MNNLIFPKPSPGPEYQELLSAGFAKYPNRKQNYELWASVQKTGYSKCSHELNYMPIKLDIELSNTCNLKCEMCYLQFKIEEKYHLEFDKIKDILDENYGLIEVRIQGISEPLLAANTLVESIRYAADRYIWTRTTTNGTLLHKNENYKRIIDAGIGEFGVSIDGATKDTYELIRKGSDFELVCQNSKLLNDYCATKNINKTRMWVVVQKDNIDELHLFPKLAQELGFKRVTLSLYVIDWGMEVMHEKNKGKVVHVDQTKIDGMVQIGKDLGVEVSFWDHSGKFNSQNICNWPFERGFISSDGSMVPCCVLPGPKVMNFGNIHRDSFVKIWQSESLSSFRLAHQQMRIPKACLECYEH